MTAAQINSLFDSLDAALASGDYAAAKLTAIRAKAALAAIPDTQNGATSIRYDRAALDQIIATVSPLAAQQATSNSGGGSKGIRVSKIQYIRPGAGESY
jgi:hypothetical protein